MTPTSNIHNITFSSSFLSPIRVIHSLVVSTVNRNQYMWHERMWQIVFQETLFAPCIVGTWIRLLQRFLIFLHRKKTTGLDLMEVVASLRTLKVKSIHYPRHSSASERSPLVLAQSASKPAVMHDRQGQCSKSEALPSEIHFKAFDFQQQPLFDTSRSTFTLLDAAAQMLSNNHSIFLHVSPSADFISW